MLKKYFNKRDLLFGFLFVLIFISTCVGVMDWQAEARLEAQSTPQTQTEE